MVSIFAACLATMAFEGMQDYALFQGNLLSELYCNSPRDQESTRTFTDATPLNYLSSARRQAYDYLAVLGVPASLLFCVIAP